MRMNLYLLFSSFGEVLQVRMRPTQQLRGQAFVVFKEQYSADKAKVDLQGLTFFSMPMVSTAAPGGPPRRPTALPPLRTY